MRNGKRVKTKSVLAAMLAAGYFTAAASATPVETVGDVSVWNVGTGQANGDFQVTDDTDFNGGPIQLGIRATLRQVGNITPSGNVYTVESGIQPGTGGDPRARWNFDLHINYDGTVGDLDTLTLTIASNNANTPAAGGAYDLLLPGIRNNIDCHVLGCAGSNDPGGSSGAPYTPEPEHFYQSSQNPVFSWFDPAFDSDLVGEYTFTLTAVEGNTTVSSDMIVNVIPAPGAALLAMFSLPMIGWVKRRMS